MRPGHYDLLRPSQANRADGSPALTVEDLGRLCNDIRPRSMERGISRTDSNSNSNNNQAVPTGDAIPPANIELTFEIRNLLSIDYPSLLTRFEELIDTKDAIQSLSSISRVLLTSSYPCLRSEGGAILHRNDSYTLPHLRINLLKGTEQEIIALARRQFLISDCREIYLRPVSQRNVLEPEAFVVCIRGQVTLQIDCSELILSPNQFRLENPSNIFTITFDLAIHNTPEALICLFVRLLDVPTDCYLTSSDSLLTDLWDLSEAQMIDPGMYVCLFG